MKCESYFCGEKKKNLIKPSFAEFAQRVVKVNDLNISFRVYVNFLKADRHIVLSPSYPTR